jgi:hypothetical protein
LDTDLPTRRDERARQLNLGGTLGERPSAAGRWKPSTVTDSNQRQALLTAEVGDQPGEVLKVEGRGMKDEG